MNRSGIFKVLQKLNFDRNEYIVFSGSSLVVQGIRNETSDIDLTISVFLENELISLRTNYHFAYDGNKVYSMDDIELFRKFYEETEFIEIEGFRFASLESILKFKLQMNREKDKPDIISLERKLYIK